MLASLVLLTPQAGIVALAALVPLGAFLLARRRIAQARRALRLSDPSAGRFALGAAAAVAVPLVLAVVAMQPAIRSVGTVAERTDAQAMIVIDTSRSMLAAARPGAPTRLARARAAAIRIRQAIADVPTGVASFTDRVLPDLLPVQDLITFDATVERAVAIAEPPPSDQNVTATDLLGLGALGTGDYFPASATHRVAIVLTDGESRAFDTGAIAKDLHGVKLVLVHIGSASESVFDGTKPEQGYHPDPRAAQTLAGLAQAVGGASYAEGGVGSAIARVKADLGSGPTAGVTRSERTRTLAPYVAVVAFVLLTGLFLTRGRIALAPLATRLRKAAA